MGQVRALKVVHPISSLIDPIDFHIHIAFPFPHLLIGFLTLPIKVCYILHLHLPCLFHRPLSRISNFLLHLSCFFLRQGRCSSYCLACVRCGLCDFVLGEALGLLPLAFESASCFAFLRCGCVGIGAGRHDEQRFRCEWTVSLIKRVYLRGVILLVGGSHGYITLALGPLQYFIVDGNEQGCKSAVGVTFADNLPTRV